MDPHVVFATPPARLRHESFVLGTIGGSDHFRDWSASWDEAPPAEPDSSSLLGPEGPPLKLGGVPSPRREQPNPFRTPVGLPSLDTGRGLN